MIVAVGRVPNTDELGLAEAGVAVGPDGLIAVGEDMRADRADRGGRRRRRRAGAGAQGHRGGGRRRRGAERPASRVRRRRPIPIVIFSDPEIGSVGLERGAGPRGRPGSRRRHLPAGRVRARRRRWARARASPGSSPTPRPTASWACTSSARTPASSSAEGALAIELMAAPGDVAATIHPHPTLSEGLREAAELMLGRPLHVALARAKA